MKDRFLRALRREAVDKTPIWIMRQAGRYLPEYRATRERAGDFLTLCKTPELATEVTLQPLARFPLDAAIVFSDILTIPDAMGLGLTLEEGVGPRFSSPVRTSQAIKALGIPDPIADLGYVMDAIQMIKAELPEGFPLIGFCGSPWTLATYMIEGGSGGDFKLTKSLLYDEPQSMHTLLDKLTEASIAYLNAQIAAGVDAVMIFDTWGGALAHQEYLDFSLRTLAEIVANINPGTPNILFTKGGGQWLEQMAATGCSALGLDWTSNISHARERVGSQVALQGNLDPAILRARPEVIAREAEKILRDFGQHNGHVFNLGHGITPDIDPEHVAALVTAVHNFEHH